MDSEGSGASRAGGEGLHNEDAFVVEEGLGLYVVCDGASARPGGEVAAHVAAHALEQFVEHAGEELDLRGDAAARATVSRAMRYALGAVEDAEEVDPELSGLTTTITMLLVKGDRGVVGHRGDSRAYLIRRNRLIRLTVDDEVTTELSRGNGDGAPGFDVFGVDLEPGDVVVLCTDGAEDVVEEGSILRSATTVSPRVLASRIVSTAHRQHSRTDATAVVVRVRGEAEPGWIEVSELPRGNAFRTLALA